MIKKPVVSRRFCLPSFKKSGLIFVFSFFLFADMSIAQAAVLFQDNFNYTDSVNNHGWSAGSTSSIAVGAGPDGSNALKIIYNCDSNSCGDRWHNWDAPANTQELDIKFNFKFDCGSGSCVGGTKFLKLFGIRNGTNYANTTTATTYQTNIFDQLSYGCSGTTRDTASIVTYAGSSSCGGTVTGTKPGPINAMDGNWHTWELHMKYNDNSQTNAIYEVWYDNVKVIGLTGITNRDNSNSLYFDYICLGGWNQFYGGSPYSVYYDNVVISNTPGGSDTTPPAWPTGTSVAANATNSTSITVTWTAATDDVGVTGYTVQRCTGLPAACPDASFATVGTPATSPFVNNTGLSPNTDYSYRVRASDAAGNVSGWTNVVSAKTQPLATPVITSPLTASATTGSAFSYQITASNTPTSYNATGLPAWASVNTNTGVISGTPSTTGTTNITIRATNAAGTGTATLVLTVTTPPPISQNLLLGLNFDEGTGTTSSDISGHNHTGTLSNATWSSGKTGSGISFSGNANSYVSIPNESDFDFTNNFTVSLWMKTASFGSAWAALVSKGDSSWSLTRYASTNTLDFNSFSPSANDLQGTANVANDAWHHVAIVYDGTTKKLYVDGNIDAQASFTQTLSTNNFPVRIGGNAEYTSGAFNGSVDDVRIYNKALTQTEIQTDMNTPLTQGGTDTFSPCNTVTTTNFSQSAYNGYGAPYDAFQTSTNLINASCSSSDSHTIQATLGQTGDSTRIVYTKGYYYDPGIADWHQFTGTCTGALNGEWCQGSITASITDTDISTASAIDPAYFVGMTCSIQGGGWKCGCRDTTCSNFYWQVQGAGL
ncbi:MAG: fibronectin type III domain-containing protein [Candidatus Moraniibacteriota bacterium]|nr:MAG: fibronectin type III domain-containing protein [Candidatus Moranbacteria bacterium]